MNHHCIVCNSTLVEPLYIPNDQPLAALNLPKSKESAKNALTYEMHFHMCLSCTHVFNTAFDYYKIPYEEDSNLMYNAGSGWRVHLKDVAKLIAKASLKGKCIVDIGCGDGGFLEELRALEPDARYIGFEPGTEAKTAINKGLEIYQDYFIAQRDMQTYKPDIIICRHVIEHLSNPKEFVEQISHHALMCGIEPLLVAEVPNIQNALDQLRVADYLYEHVSNFTPKSFQRLFEISGFDVVETQTMYQDEVVVISSQVSKQAQTDVMDQKAKALKSKLDKQKQTLQEYLQELTSKGKSIALWGGTGKSASFINSFELDCETYPRVVDSDERKCGRYVPGAGQFITHSSTLNSEPCDILVITTNWRALDIASEIKQRGIVCEKIVMLQDGEVVEVKA